MGLAKDAQESAPTDSAAERRRHEIRAQEYRMAIQTASDGYWATDLQGRLLEVNPAYAEASGYSRKDLLTMQIDALDACDNSADLRQRMAAIVQAGRGRFVTVHRTRDGRRWPVEMVASYANLEGGRLFWFIRDLTAQQKSAELIWHQANFDRLTALPNRALFFDRLSQECAAARRNSKRVALLYADLDAFKPVNDRLGHAAGDVALQTVASRWQACMRSTDTLARLGGDEFAIIAGHLESSDEAATIAGKLISALAHDLALPDGQTCRLGVSIGIALYPDNAAEMDSLLSAADSAMFACKATGKNGFAFSNTRAQPPHERANWFTFQDALLVGVREIDEQHRQLIRLVNELNQDISAHASDAHIGKRLDELIAYTLFHFQTEQNYMLAHQYPQIQAHAYEHDQLSNELRQIAERRSRAGDLLALQKIKDWLLAHIRNSDKDLGRFLQQHGVA
jgi:diguanylate cyclase (GGDEF)-like protein/hemerythrin-like metal-binding protein/PAS domain S-box-containing protein